MRILNEHLTQSGGPVWFPKEVQFELRLMPLKREWQESILGSEDRNCKGPLLGGHLGHSGKPCDWWAEKS